MEWKSCDLKLKFPPETKKAPWTGPFTDADAEPFSETDADAEANFSENILRRIYHRNILTVIARTILVR